MHELDRLFDMRDLDSAEDRLREAIVTASDTATRLHANVLLARVLGLKDDPDAAKTLLQTVHDAMGDDDLLQTRYLLERGRLEHDHGDKAHARTLFLEAYEHGQRADDDYYAIDAAHMVAYVDYDDPALSLEEKQQWNLTALQLAETSTRDASQRWRGSLMNNIGWTYFQAERFQQALEIFTRAVPWFKEHGTADKVALARYAVAKTLRQMGNHHEALLILRELEIDNPEDGYIHEELGENLLALDNAAEAGIAFANAYELLSQDTWLVNKEPERLARLKSLGGL